MATQDHLELFERLFQQTREGKLNWKDTVDKGTYVVSFKDYAVEILRADSQEGPDSAVVLGLRNAEGEIVERVDDFEVAQLFPNDASRRSFFQKSEQLYELARRNALGADKALNSILNELRTGNKDDIPF